MASSQCPPVETYQLTHKKILHFCRRRNWVSIYVKRDPRHNVDAVVAERTFFVPLCRSQLSPFRKEAIGLRPTSLLLLLATHTTAAPPASIMRPLIGKRRKLNFSYDLMLWQRSRDFISVIRNFMERNFPRRRNRIINQNTI